MADVPEYSTACPDWEQRLIEKKSIIPPPIFPASAEKGWNNFKKLRVCDVQGTPTFEQSHAPWAEEFVKAVFGGYDERTGIQHIKEIFLLISKKNSKSTLAAGLVLTAMLLNKRTSAELSILAPTVEVSRNSFFPVRDMIAANTTLSQMFTANNSYRKIIHNGTKAELRVIASDTKTVAGSKSFIVLIDELWEFGLKANAADILREATGGLLSHPSGFVIYITTQSSKPPAGIFRQKLEYARMVRDGNIVDNKFLPILYEFPRRMIDDGSCLEPRNFYITNPNLGVSIDEDTLVREFQKAKVDGGEAYTTFLSKHLNIEQGLLSKDGSWDALSNWHANEINFSLDELIDMCNNIVVGIDGGGQDDLLALCVLGQHPDTDVWYMWTAAWAVRSIMDKYQKISGRLQDLSERDNLYLTDAGVVDLEPMADIVAKIHAAGKLKFIGLDSHGIADIRDALVGAGTPQKKIYYIAQGWKLTPAIKTAERRLAAGMLKHPKSELMEWCLSNVRVVPAGTSSMAFAKHDTTGASKIDPVIALMNAVQCMAHTKSKALVPLIS